MLSLYQKSFKADEMTNRIAVELQSIKDERDAFLYQARNKSLWESGTADDTFQKTLECVANEECKEKQGYCLTIGRTHLFMCKTHFDSLDFETDDLFLAKVPGMWYRAQIPDNWCKEEYDNDYKYISIKDILCSDTDVCWYHSHADRLSGYHYSYRLKGSDDIYFCDVCWDNCVFGNFSDHMISLIEDADVNFED
jgi:hypothetical protein